MNHLMVLFKTINQVDSYYGCVCGPLTWDTKDISWVEDPILIMTCEYLAIGSSKYHIIDMT